MKGDWPGLRIGHGFDAHRFEAGRALVLGGVPIEHSQGLAGHSDADVLVHAVIDALFGAMALGDLGRHFPSEDARWRGADSLELLERAHRMVREAGGRPVQVDCTLLLEAPRVAPHIPAMRAHLARVLDLPLDRISVKASTTDGLGFLGREDGAAASAVVLVVTDAAGTEPALSKEG